LGWTFPRPTQIEIHVSLRKRFVDLDLGPFGRARRSTSQANFSRAQFRVETPEDRRLLASE